MTHQQIEDEARHDWIRERPSLVDIGDAYDPLCDGDTDGRPNPGRGDAYPADAAKARA
jgi:hypothetical protein